MILNMSSNMSKPAVAGQQLFSIHRLYRLSREWEHLSEAEAQAECEQYAAWKLATIGEVRWERFCEIMSDYQQADYYLVDQYLANPEIASICATPETLWLTDQQDHTTIHPPLASTSKDHHALIETWLANSNQPHTKIGVSNRTASAQLNTGHTLHIKYDPALSPMPGMSDITAVINHQTKSIWQPDQQT